MTREPAPLVKFECDGCDTTQTTDSAVVVAAPGTIALVVTCPDWRCRATKMIDRLDLVETCIDAGVTVVKLTAGAYSRAGAQCDGPISDAEVTTFAARLAMTPDGRTPRRQDYGLMVVLSGLWREVRDGVAP